jgi:uncharacterized membrane protein
LFLQYELQGVCVFGVLYFVVLFCSTCSHFGDAWLLLFVLTLIPYLFNLLIMKRTK